MAHFVIDGGIRSARRPEDPGKPDAMLDPDAIAGAGPIKVALCPSDANRSPTRSVHAPTEPNHMPSVPSTSYFGNAGSFDGWPTEPNRNRSNGIFVSDPVAPVNAASVKDGTSNTICVVEAKRDIPWTKPEDIPFDVEGQLPKLGGYAHEGFAAAIADGSVRFFASTIDPTILKAMFTAGGGEIIEREQLDAPARQLPPPRTTPPREALRK